MKLILILILSFSMVGCGTFKKVSNKTDHQSTNSIDSSLKAYITTKTDAKTDKEVKTVITEKIDTHIVVPGTATTVTRPLNELIEKHMIETSDGDITVKVTYDPTTGSIKAEGKTAKKTVPVQSTKTTVVLEDSQSTQAVEKTEQIDNAVKVDSKVTDKTSSKEVDRDSGTNPFTSFGIMIFIILVIAAIFYLYRRFG